MSSREDIKSTLQIKPVGLKHIKQYNELLRYVFQVTERQLSDSGYEDGELIRSKRPVLQEAEVFGWFTEDDNLVSQICIYPCQVNIHGAIINMGGVTGVGTYPEYSGLGLMSDLVKVALEKMRSDGQYISYLYPYSVPYYRRKGWEIMSDKMTFNLRDTQLPKYEDTQGHVERLKVGDERVVELYDRFARENHGALIRNKFEWDEYWRWDDEESRTAAVWFDTDNNPQGYIFYWVEGDIFNIKEMIYLTQQARKGLWNFITAHFTMIDSVRGEIFAGEPLSFLLDDSQIVETIEPYYMARIVDVSKFLEQYPFADFKRPFHFEVTDPVAEWNNGVFALYEDQNGDIKVSRERLGKCVRLDIQTLSTMLMSYRSPSYLHKIERITADKPTLKLLDDIVPDTQPYFSDYF